MSADALVRFDTRKNSEACLAFAILMLRVGKTDAAKKRIAEALQAI